MVSVEATSVEGMTDAMKEEVQRMIYGYAGAVKEGEITEAIKNKITMEWDRLYDDKTKKTVDSQWESVHSKRMSEQMAEVNSARMQQAEDAGIARMVERADEMEEMLFD